MRGRSFVSGRHTNNSASPSKSIFPSGVKTAIVVIALALPLCSYTLAESGAETYKTKCSPCHGANGAGETMIGKNLKLRSLASPEVQNQSDAQLSAIISQGKNRMPRFDRRLSRDQIAAVVKYIRLLKK